MLESAEAKEREESRRRVIRTHPATPEWIKRFTELKALREEAMALVEKAMSRHKRIWSEVEESLDYYGRMSWNERTQEIEVLDTENPKDED